MKSSMEKSPPEGSSMRPVKILPAPSNARERQVLTGYGAGIRLNYPDWGSVRFDAAWPLTEVDPSNDDDVFFYVNVILNLN